MNISRRNSIISLTAVFLPGCVAMSSDYRRVSIRNGGDAVMNIATEFRSVESDDLLFEFDGEIAPRDRHTDSEGFEPIDDEIAVHLWVNEQEEPIHETIDNKPFYDVQVSVSEDRDVSIDHTYL